jgi:hypothetical protein
MKTYTNTDAVELLTRLARYAEAFRTDHSDPDITIKQLVDDLVDGDSWTGEERKLVEAEELRDRVYDGLNGIEHEPSTRGESKLVSADYLHLWVARHVPSGVERGGFTSLAAAEQWVEQHEDGDEYEVVQS